MNTLRPFLLATSTFRCVVPSMSSTSFNVGSLEGFLYSNLLFPLQILHPPMVNPNGFLRALGTPEDNYNLGTTADEALLSRRQPHRNFDSSTPPESPPTPATPATPPPTTTPTPTRSRPRAPPPVNILPPLPGSSTSTPWTTSSRGSTTSTLSSALDRSHQRSLDGRGLLHGHLWQATRFRTSTPAPTPLNSTDVPSPTLPEPAS